MKNILFGITITTAILFGMNSAMAETKTMFGIDFNQPINKQFAGDPYTTWVEGGIQVAEPQRGIRYVTIEVSGFDANGDTYATGGFFLRSNDIADEKSCQTISLKIKEQIIQGTKLSSYISHDKFGCKKGYDNEWYFVYGGDINPK